MNELRSLMINSAYLGENKRLSQVIEEFKTWRGFRVTGHTVVRYDGPLRIFCLTMGDPEIERIKDYHVMGHLVAMERLGWKRNGISITAQAFITFFEYCELKGYKTVKPELIPRPKREFKLPRVANERDYRRLLRAAVVNNTNNSPNGIRNLALLKMIWDTWARSGEVVSLNESDLNFNKDLSGYALIRTEKSRGRRPIREIYWTVDTGKTLKKWLKRKHELETNGVIKCVDGDAVFISLQKCGGYDRRGNRMTSRGVSEMMRMLSNRAKLPTIFNAHSARHFGGREIIRQGGSNADVSNILGHSHIESSYIYQMMWGKDLERRYHKFKKEKITKYARA